MALTNAIYNNYLIHLLTLYTTIITHILYKDNCQSYLFKVVCHAGEWAYSYYIVLVYYGVAEVSYENVIVAFSAFQYKTSSLASIAQVK